MSVFVHFAPSWVHSVPFVIGFVKSAYDQATMIDPSLLHAIREDPDDDAPRLAFADWLDANGQADRAEWIRASVDYAAIPHDDERWQAAMEREMDAFRGCKPPWFEYLSNIDQKNDRGVFRFVLGETRSRPRPDARETPRQGPVARPGPGRGLAAPDRAGLGRRQPRTARGEVERPGVARATAGHARAANR